MHEALGVPRGSRTRGRLVLGASILVVVLGLALVRGGAGLWTDKLWFDQLGQGDVWLGLFGTRVALGAGFALLLTGLILLNLVIADRAAPRLRPTLTSQEETLVRLDELLRRRRSWLRLAVALALGLSVGAIAADRWDEWILFRNQVEFGTRDPQFDRDVGFYVFRLPFLSFLADWAIAAIVVMALATAALYYLNGGIRAVGGFSVLPRVQTHLSLLFGALAVAKGANYYLDRFELTVSTRGVVDGAAYTDVNAQLQAINLLIVISLFAAVLFLYNARRRRFLLPVIAVGLWGLVALVAGGIYPAAIQRFRVEPAESTKEREYIARNIEATRAALGLDDVQIQPFAYDEELRVEQLAENAETIRNVRLWDPRVLRRTYQRLQEVRTFYRFTDVDVDRYTIDGDKTQIVLSARELNPGSLPSDTWENRHMAFTHGYGAVLSPANAVTSDGQPDFLVRNIPPQGAPAIIEPRLYHGEAIGGYAIVNAGRDEIDYLREDGTAVTNRYDGRGGVSAGSIVRRAAFALRFGDLNPLISGFMTPEARVLYIRDIRERVQTLAPFLHYDHDPYPVVLDGRIVWIVDAYTTSSHYPYGQRADTSRLDDGSGLRHGFNYVRNSVKVTVDAYDGDVTFYIVDADEPIAAAYARRFPGLFTPPEEIPDDLRAHFRYPEDLFRVQTDMWGRYHIGDPDEFYSQSDRWNVAQDPGSAAQLEPATPPTDPGADPGADLPAPAGPERPRGEARMDPYYLVMRLPGESSTEFLMLRPFVPFSEDDTRRELSAFMVARSDPEAYGSLEVFVMPRDRQVDGPAIVNARINQDPEISQLITLLSRAGSEVLLGNLVIIPIEQSLLYIRPLYVQATGANAVPELKRVIVVFGERIAVRDTLQQALAAVFGDAPETLEEGPGQGPLAEAGVGPVEGVPDRVRELLAEAARAFAAADAALRAGEFAAYEEHIREARATVDRARSAGGDGV